MKTQAVLIIAVVSAALAASQPPPETSVSIQIRVLHGGAPADGPFDIEAALYDDPSSGSQVGSTLSFDGVAIVDGSLTLSLDFGPLSNNARWLELRLRPTGAGAFSTLEPRYLLTSAPMAVETSSADVADAADDAALLEGQPASTYMAWTNHTGVPADLADGDDDTAAGLSCDAGQVAVWSGGGWACGDDRGARYARTHIVAPVGDPAANGAALLAAMAAIPTPAGAHEAQLLTIEPGRYDLDGTSLVMQPWVDIEGSGQTTTVVTSNGVATVNMASDCEVRNLSVENSNAALSGIAINCELMSRSRLTDVTARATGASVSSQGIYMDCDDFVIRRTTATASGGTNLNRAIYASAINGGILEDVVAHGDGGSYSIGVMATCESARRIESRGVDASTECQGAQFTCARTVADVIAVGSTTSGVSRGLVLCPCQSTEMVVSGATARGDVALTLDAPTGSLVQLASSTLEGGTTGVTFLSNYSGAELQINNSTVSGSSSTISNPGATIRIGGSRMLGGPISGTVTCTVISDETHSFFANSCPM